MTPQHPHTTKPSRRVTKISPVWHFDPSGRAGQNFYLYLGSVSSNKGQNSDFLEPSNTAGQEKIPILHSSLVPPNPAGQSKLSRATGAGGGGREGMEDTDHVIKVGGTISLSQATQFSY